MNMYEMIIDILEKYGPVSFHTICEVINERNWMNKGKNSPVQVSHVKSVVSRKRDLFSVTDDIVSIREEKELLSLSVMIGGFPGHSFKVEVDFIHQNFYMFEWNSDGFMKNGHEERTIYIGSFAKFKKEIMRLKIWEWERDYQPESLLLDGTNWSVVLRTKGKIYESEGFQNFPGNWKKFCRVISQLVGITLQ